MASNSSVADGAQLERQSGPLKRRPRKCLKLPRLRGPLILLLVVDLILFLLLLHALEPLITLLLRNGELFPVEPIPFHHPLPNAKQNKASQKIPRILHQTCANATVPDKWVAAQQSCLEMYPDFEYKLWTDETARELIASEYPWFVNMWDNYAFPIQRADAIRYFLLYHFGGLYLDMDTYCRERFPLDEFEKAAEKHVAIFEATLPTGVTNDFMVSSARHPAFRQAIAKLPAFYRISRFWAHLQPYANIMLSSGPLFITLAVQDYLLQLASLPSATVRVVSPFDLKVFIGDMQSSTWHKADAHALMWLGERPWIWFASGGIAVVAGMLLTNKILLVSCTALGRRTPSIAFGIQKLAKLA